MTGGPGVGDFGVTPLGGHAGRLIRIGQWLNGDGYADFEHAFVVVTADGAVVEARPGGAGYNRAGDYPAAVYYTCPEDARPRVAAAAIGLVGCGYSWADYFALAAVRFHLPLSSRLLRRRVEKSGHQICSQLVDTAYLRAGVHLFDDGRTPGDVTPGDLYKLIVEQQRAATGEGS